MLTCLAFRRGARQLLVSKTLPKAVVSANVVPPTCTSFSQQQQQARLYSVTTAAKSTVVTNTTGTTGNSVWKHDMFCRQCEQTLEHKACVTEGVCGKTSETAACQDALLYAVQSMSIWADAARQTGNMTAEELAPINQWTLQAVFSTLTNVNFSDDRIAAYIQHGEDLKHALKYELGGTLKTVSDPSVLSVANVDLRGKDVLELEEFGATVGVLARQAAMNNDDAFCLNELATYGLKGLCAYACHCHQLGRMDESVMAAVHSIFAKLASSAPDTDGLLQAVLKVGETNATVMAMLDDAHATTFGAPEVTAIRTSVVAGKAILVSGHDLKDLYELLQQTAGTGVNVYTHGEMLPAHTYPKLKAFPHLVGNYGTAWQNQKFEFAAFPGPIIVTTNCILEPRKIYKNRLYTMNEVGLDGVQHIGPNRDYSAVIAQAQKLKGFPMTIEPATYHTAGFNHRVVLPIADKVIQAAKDGQLSRIFLIGGCDGSQWERNYFTDLAEETPADSLILTLGCAKNRIIHSEKLMGATLANGLPRVLDMGQCNDSYSAVVVALELAKALNCSVNELPLSLALSHLEQKAAAVLLTLLHLGVKNIRLGPSLPAYLTPNVLRILSKEYNLMPTGNVVQDLAMMQEGK